jgi:hypothetical protein
MVSKEGIEAGGPNKRLYNHPHSTAKVNKID